MEPLAELYLELLSTDSSVISDLIMKAGCLVDWIVGRLSRLEMVTGEPSALLFIAVFYCHEMGN